MAITMIDGNAIDVMLATPGSILIHCANCQNIMGSGIAGELRQRLPQVVKADTDYYRAMQKKHGDDGPELMLGNFSHTVKDPDTFTVYNAYGQLAPGVPQPRPLNYGAIARALTIIALDTELDVIIGRYGKGKAMPDIIIPYKMGCDRAGGDWTVVSEMIEFIFRKFPVTIVKLPENETRLRRY